MRLIDILLAQVGQLSLCNNFFGSGHEQIFWFASPPPYREKSDVDLELLPIGPKLMHKSWNINSQRSDC